MPQYLGVHLGGNMPQYMGIHLGGNMPQYMGVYKGAYKGVEFVPNLRVCA